MGGRAGGGASGGMGSGSRSAASLPDKVSAKETKQALNDLRTYVTYPLALNNEMAESYYYQYDVNKVVKSLVKSKEIKEGLFKQIDKSSSLSNYKKGAIKKMIETTLSKDKENVVIV